ncbi:MAG TPA: ATP-binding protein [Candidatus Sulfotelmatobacter sp.]|jgi:anti-sigma regulatory factor (Ser/Thr protein kinase)|nr:ATP-binding protein [Candidatus Sulfotelmatobacter sp.]
MECNEKARLQALRRYQILDTDPEKAFDDLTILASHICETPVALITLIDSERQWFKSKVGVSVSETPREISFCARAIQQSDLFIVPDASKDPRFSSNPFVVSDPKIRFYAGAPFTSADGHPLGTLCVVDLVPRQLTPSQESALLALSRQVQAQFELRKNLMELRAALAERDRAEAERDRNMVELQNALQHVQRLSGLLPACSVCKLDVTIPANPNAISGVVDGVMQIARQMRCAVGHEFQVELALREALANAIVHGCNNDPSKKVECCVACTESSDVVIVVRDPGEGFVSSAVPNPVAAENLESTHGRGIYLINQLMDEVSFERNGAEIRMRKAAAASASPSASEVA